MIKEIFSNPLITLAVGGIGMSLLSRATKVPGKLFSKIKDVLIFSVRVGEERWDLYKALSIYLQVEHPRSIRSADAVTNDNDIIYYHRELLARIKYKGKRMVISAATKELPMANGLQMEAHHYTIRGFGVRGIMTDFLKEVLENYKEVSKPGVVKVGSFNTSYASSVAWVNEVKGKKPQVLFYQNNLYDKLRDDLAGFLVNKQWYEDRGLIYKRSYLLYGPPGTGKTALITTLAAELGYNICLIDLNVLDSNPNFFQTIKPPSKCFLALEDMDRAFKGDKKIHIAGLLSSLDGMLSRDGTIIFATVNDVSVIDEAIMREGRMDVKMEVPPVTNREISEYFKMFFNEYREFPPRLISPIAKIQELCIRNKDNPEEAYKNIINIS